MNANNLKNFVSYVGWEVSAKCNLHCPFCYAFIDEKPSECSLDQINHGLDNLKAIGTIAVNIGGGEPLIRPDIVEILKAAKQKGFNVFLSTNGLLLTENLLSTIGDYVDWICLSFDSADKNINDFFRRPGHYDKIMELIELAKAGKFKPKIKINTIVHAKNYNSILPIGELLKDINCKWKLMQFKPRNRGNRNQHELSISHEEFNHLVEKVKSEYSQLDISSSGYDPDEAYEFLIIRQNGFCFVPKGDKYLPVASVFDPELQSKLVDLIGNPEIFFEENRNLLTDSYNFNSY